MKKQIVAIALVTGLALSSTAFANWGGRGGGNFACPQMMSQGGPPPMVQQLDPETQAKVNQFFTDNQALRKQIVMKRAEKMALMQADTPDPKAVAAVTGELFDLHTQMFDKAQAAGVAEFVGPGMGRMGDGPGFGWGGRGGKRGMGGMGCMQRGWQD